MSQASKHDEGKGEKNMPKGKREGSEPCDAIARRRMTWHPTTEDELERRQAARDVVQALLMLPQQPVDAPEVLHSGSWKREDGNEAKQGQGRSGPTAQAAAPISYTEAAERFVLLGYDINLDDPEALVDPAQRKSQKIDPRDYQPKPRVGERSKRKTGAPGDDARTFGPMSTSNSRSSPSSPISNGAGAAAGTSPKPRAPMVRNVRPGKGGRRLANTASTSQEAIQGVAEHLGVEPIWRPAAKGAIIVEFPLSDEGDTLGSIRLSGREMQKGETLLGQAAPIVDLAKHWDLGLRGLIVAMNMTGTILDLEERPDLSLHMAAIEAGWCKNVIWRDGDRIAREVYPAERYYHELRKARVDLWLCCWARKVNWNTDKTNLRAMNMVSASERDASTKRLQTAQIRQGPMAGKGHPGPTKFGSMRDENGYLVTDPEAWPYVWRAFELADIGDLADGDEAKPLSCPKIAAKLEDECPMDHNAWRRLLRNIFYATGEYTSEVRGLAIGQIPMRFTDDCPPIPLDRFERVQDNLTIRKGRNNTTPVGTFLFNAIKAEHRPCKGRRRKGKTVMVKAQIQKGREPRYRHSGFSPGCCEVKSWAVEDLERPPIAALRTLVDDPELQLAWAEAAQHDVSEEQLLLGDQGRHEIQKQIKMLEAEKQTLETDYIKRIANEGGASVDEYRDLTSAVKQQIEGLRRRLDTDAARQEAVLGASRSAVHDELREAFLNVMTFETPTDPIKRSLRARIFQRCIPALEFGEDENGKLVFDLYGPLVPTDAPFVAVTDPVKASEDLLERYVDHKNGKKPVPDREKDKLEPVLNQLVRSGGEVGIDQLLVLHERPTTHELRAKRRLDLEAKGWSQRTHPHDESLYAFHGVWRDGPVDE